MRIALSALMIGLSIPLALSVGACGGDDDDDDDATTTATGTDTNTNTNTGSGGSISSGGLCDGTNAAQPCGTNCPFDPATLDCAAACTNVAAICSNNDCDAQCTGMEQDPTTCQAACNGTKTLNCTNLVFGCYATNTTCAGVGTCVDAQR
ncbi:MAG: hypothetical protein JRI23_20595 [Deltaproteobacteria bacterium]|jgi:hypothetical protein|nr:hypothetical protein [Deltaproteobacteria bacterium]MBW2534287.1 hypothetical protein [Deltaproteobacteria bacterium]